MIYRFFAVFLLLLFSATIAAVAEDITIDVYSSDEELFEAYLLGDIDYQTYLNLKELYELGIDNTEIHLLKEIPNINIAVKTDSLILSGLEKEQSESFVLPPLKPQRGKLTGFLRLRAYQKVEEHGNNKSHTTLRTYFGDHWRFDGKFNEDYSGNKTFQKRTIVYKGIKGPAKKIVLGNYSAKFGLGLSVGYHGILLNKEDETMKSLAFPEYGGFNGIYVKGGRKQDEVNLMAHFDQNDQYSVRAGALDIAKKYNRFRYDIIVLAAALRNKDTKNEFVYYQLGGCVKYRYMATGIAFETVYSNKTQTLFPAFNMEADYRKGNVNLNLFAWHYDDDYVNFLTGSRSGSFYQTIDIDTVEYSYSDRRVGQNGFLAKSRTAFPNGSIGEITFSAYGKRIFKDYIKSLLAYEMPFTENSVIRITYQGFKKNDFGKVLTENEIRTGYRLTLPEFYLRSYIGYSDDKNGTDYISLFSKIKWSVRSLGRVDMWINFGKINYENSEIDYFYGYIMESFKLSSLLELALKYSYRYNRNYTDREQSTFLLEAKVRW